ncbi:hypothetical protein ACP4OV_020862 [Aristida adscensionis]
MATTAHAVLARGGAWPRLYDARGGGREPPRPGSGGRSGSGEGDKFVDAKKEEVAETADLLLSPLGSPNNRRVLRSDSRIGLFGGIEFETWKQLRPINGATKGKCTIVLGQDCMAFCSEVEDVISMRC